MRSAISSRVVAGLCAAVLLTCSAESLRRSHPGPDVVLVTLDTLRRDHVGAYVGGETLTPHLDALAKRGLLHDHAFTSMPTTGPAHLSLFTGLHPSEHRGLANGEPLAPSHTQRDAARRLAAAGYATGAFTATSFLSLRATGLHGFEVYDSPGGRRNVTRPGSEAVDAALDWLREVRRRPVFLWVHLYDAHAPYGDVWDKRVARHVDPRDYGWVTRDRFADPDARARMAGLYADGVRQMDAALGRLLEGLASELEAEPLLLLVADHGESLDEHLDSRGYAYDHGEFLDPESIRILLLVVGPEVAPGRSAGAVSIRDLYTTLLAAAGLDDPEAVAEGRRDLRTASDARRVVSIERRHFRSAVRPEVRNHAAAATDGSRSVLVSESGLPTGGAVDVRDLVHAAQARVGRAKAGPVPRPDPSTREALRALGYAE